MSPPACLLCDAPTAAWVRSGAYRYWWCASCKTAQVLPPPSIHELTQFYGVFHASEEAGGCYDHIEERMQTDFPAKARLARRLASGPKARLLDVGCGKGFFLQEANRVGFSSSGIDLSPTGVEYATRVLAVDAVVGRIDDACPPEWKEAFDIATFWATIEHVPDPRATLRGIFQCLKPGGILILDTGLAGVAAESLLPGHSQWYDAPQHLWVFGEPGLRRVLAQSGFQPIHLDRNYDRSVLRRVLRWTRHSALCLAAFAATRLLLGKRAYHQCRLSTKWPIGRLISVTARKPSQ